MFELCREGVDARLFRLIKSLLLPNGYEKIKAISREAKERKKRRETESIIA